MAAAEKEVKSPSESLSTSRTAAENGPRTSLRALPAIW